MKNFSMSMYETKEQLLEAEIEYLEKRNSILLNRLHLSKRTNREDKQRLKNEIDYWLSIANKWKRKYREYTEVIANCECVCCYTQPKEALDLLDKMGYYE